MKKIYFLLILLFGFFQISVPPEAFSQNWLCGSSFTDSRDSKVYNTVLIGNQCWMQQNLNYGNRIKGTAGQSNNSVPEKYCYNDLDSNCTVYGGLYQWGEMVQYYNGASNANSWSPAPSGNIAGLCPLGWLLPTDNDWCTLTTYLDSTVNCATSGLTGTNAGGQMKERGTTHWLTPNAGATNASLYFGLPSGNRNTNGTFSGLYSQTGIWTMSESSSTAGYDWGLVYNGSRINRSSNNKATGLSVRCFKNCTSPPSASPCTNVPSPAQIIWKWRSVKNATGYRWYTSDDFSSATDVGSDTSYTETELTCNTSYKSYVWAYNDQ